MAKIAIFSDAHLLMQAEWLDDESQLTAEGNEVLNNFERAINDIKKEKPDAVLIAGDIFDYRTKSRHRVAHREGEKYMIRVRSILEQLTDDLGCKIYALKGNHDSRPVLRSTEKVARANLTVCACILIERFFFQCARSYSLDDFFIQPFFLSGD